MVAIAPLGFERFPIWENPLSLISPLGPKPHTAARSAEAVASIGAARGEKLPVSQPAPSHPGGGIREIEPSFVGRLHRRSISLPPEPINSRSYSWLPSTPEIGSDRVKRRRLMPVPPP